MAVMLTMRWHEYSKRCFDISADFDVMMSNMESFMTQQEYLWGAAVQTTALTFCKYR